MKKRMITILLLLGVLGVTNVSPYVTSADSYAQINVRHEETKVMFDDTYNLTDITANDIGIYENENNKRNRDYVMKAIQESGVRGLQSDMEKIKQIERYLRKSLRYDTDATQTDWQENYESFTDYCLLTGDAVCAGYAEAFQSMCLSVGIECWYVTGHATNADGERQYHAWNKVVIEGTEYYVDACWNDSTSGKYGITEELWEDHELEEVHETYSISAQTLPRP